MILLVNPKEQVRKKIEKKISRDSVRIYREKGEGTKATKRVSFQAVYRGFPSKIQMNPRKYFPPKQTDEGKIYKSEQIPNFHGGNTA